MRGAERLQVLEIYRGRNERLLGVECEIRCGVSDSETRYRQVRSGGLRVEWRPTSVDGALVDSGAQTEGGRASNSTGSLTDAVGSDGQVAVKGGRRG